MDCPLARAPYSSQTPLIDLLVNPETKAIIDQQMGGLLAKLPPMLTSTQLPSFAAIITPKELAGFIGEQRSEAQWARLDAELRAVPVTSAATLARCARYDQVPPELPATIKRPSILVFDKITGFRDSPSVDAAAAALKSLAARRGWTVFFSNNGAIFNTRDLARFDAVVWNNISGDALTVPQQDAFKDYITKGGGFAGVHGSGGDPFYVWDWYADTLIGARFLGHPSTPQFQQGRVVVNKESAITRGLGDEWTMVEEWYSFKTNPRTSGARILVTLDENSYKPEARGQDLRMGDHPLAWTRCIGNGRSFYSAIGHRPENYSESHSAQLLEAGIAWAAGLGETSCRNGLEEDRKH